MQIFLLKKIKKVEHARLATKDQAGHTTTDMTLIYYQAEEVNTEYKALQNDLFT